MKTIADCDTVLQQCQQLMHRFFHCLDHADYEPLIASFDADATWHRQGIVLNGHNAIRDAMLARSTTQRIRHVLSNIFVNDLSSDTAQLLAYMTVYRFDNGEQQTGLLNIDGPTQFYTMSATVRLGVGGAMLRTLAITPEFRFARAA